MNLNWGGFEEEGFGRRMEIGGIWGMGREFGKGFVTLLAYIDTYDGITMKTVLRLCGEWILRRCYLV